jgi:hypothetical protein
MIKSGLIISAIAWISAFVYWALVSSTMLGPRLVFGTVISFPSFLMLACGYSIVWVLLCAARFKSIWKIACGVIMFLGCLTYGIINSLPGARANRLVVPLPASSKVLSVTGSSFMDPLWAILLSGTSNDLAVIVASNKLERIGERVKINENFHLLFTTMTQGPSLPFERGDEFQGKINGLDAWLYFNTDKERLAIVLSRNHE